VPAAAQRGASPAAASTVLPRATKVVEDDVSDKTEEAPAAAGLQMNNAGNATNSRSKAEDDDSDHTEEAAPMQESAVAASTAERTSAPDALPNFFDGMRFNLRKDIDAGTLRQLRRYIGAYGG
jgi:hypothetical protein